MQETWTWMRRTTTLRRNREENRHVTGSLPSTTMRCNSKGGGLEALLWLPKVMHHLSKGSNAQKTGQPSTLDGNGNDGPSALKCTTW